MGSLGGGVLPPPDPPELSRKRKDAAFRCNPASWKLLCFGGWSCQQHGLLRTEECARVNAQVWDVLPGHPIQRNCSGLLQGQLRVREGDNGRGDVSWGDEVLLQAELDVHRSARTPGSPGSKAS